MPQESENLNPDGIEQEASWWKLSLLMAVPCFAISFCGSREPWAHGTAAILIGLCALVLPFRIRLPLVVLIPALLALIMSLGAFLPETWFPAQEWRRVLYDDYGVSLPSTHTAQPWATFHSWLLLLLGTIWLFTCLGCNFTKTERRRVMQIMAIALAILSIITIFFYYQRIEIPFWRSVWKLNYYGPFPNRNNFSGALATGSVLALAATFDAYRRKQLSWIFYLLVLLPIFSAMLLNTSRMGVVLFFGGISGWMFLATMDKRSKQLFAICISIFLMLASVFILCGRNILERFNEQSGVLTTLAADGRMHVFSDALILLNQNLLAGVGLGNFEPLFAFSKTPGTGHLITRTLHPENDWLWFTVEAGLPALLAVVAAFIALLTRFKTTHDERKNSSQKDLRVRNAGAVSVGLLAIQGLVDTPLHTIGLAALGALMAGIALNPKRTTAVTGGFSLILMRALGLICVGMGLLWMSVAAGKPLLPGTPVAEFYADESQVLTARGDYAAALGLMDRALAIHPLQWNYYFDRAQIKLALGLPFQEALNDFAITRFLEPKHANLCLREMEIWLNYSPPMAIPAVREAMRRDRNASYDYYQTINNYLHTHPELRPAVRNLATDPKLRLIYLAGATGNDFNEFLRELLTNYPTLECFSGSEKLQVFRLWFAHGDKATLIAMLESNLEWRKVGWPVLAEHHASKAEFEKACQIVLKNLHPPAFVSGRKADLAELERSFLHNTTDVVRGLELYEMQKSKGLWDPALFTLRQIAEMPKFPDQVHYERALILYRKMEYAKSWEALSLYMSKVDVLSP